jgi:hypothetical protein
VIVGNVSGNPGDEVIVPIALANNPGIAGFTYALNFENAKLLPVEVSPGTVVAGSLFSSNLQSGGDPEDLESVTAALVGASNFTGDGVLFSVKFKIKDDALEGSTPLVLTGKATNQFFAPIDLAMRPGEIDIVTFVYGNIFGGDGSTEVDIRDAVKLVQHLAGWSTVTLSNSERKAADVYADGLVDIRDAVKLAQYLAGWPNIVLGTR